MSGNVLAVMINIPIQSGKNILSICCAKEMGREKDDSTYKQNKELLKNLYCVRTKLIDAPKGNSKMKLKISVNNQNQTVFLLC